MQLTLDPDSVSKSQMRFLLSTSPYLCFSGGFGSGKSTALALKLLWFVITRPNVPGLLIAQTFGALETNVLVELWRILELTLPRRMHPKHIGGTKNPRLIFPNGAIVYLRSAENPKGYNGLTVGWVLGDEIRHWAREAYVIAVSRARLKHNLPIQRAFATTPDMNWISDEFNSNLAMHETISCGTMENEANLDELYVESLRTSYSSRLQRAVIEGIFTILEGAVFEEFDPNPETSPWIVSYKPNKDRLGSKRCYLAVDPGYRRSAWLWFVEEHPLHYICFDELMLDNTTDMSAVEQVNAKNHPIDEIWVDPAADATQSATGADTLMSLKHVRVRGVNRSPLRTLSDFTRDIPFGVDKLRVTLGNPKAEQVTRLKFAREIIEHEKKMGRGIIRDLGSLRYPELKDGRAISDKPLKDGRTDHSTDACRYFVIGQWASRPELRSRDPYMSKLAAQGYLVAA